MARPIYLDYQATTPLDPRVFEAMTPYFTEIHGNPHSANHVQGWEAKAAVDVAREDVAALLGVEPSEIIFTSGATEANNLALKGLARALRGRRNHIVTVATEHACILESAARLVEEGSELSLLPVGVDGLLDLDRVRAALRDDTAILSVMAVNNEIGVIQPLAELGRLAQERGVLFHVDAAQGFGKIALDPRALGIDLMSLSAHKIYGPKGVGALYRRGRPRVGLVPHMDGGGQEAGVRSGTLSPALCAGFGRAAFIAGAEMAVDGEKAFRHRDLLLRLLGADIPDLVVHGSLTARIPSNLNLGFPGVDGARLLREIRGLALSSSAACASAAQGPSYVLAALGVGPELAKASLRIGFGRFTSDDEITIAAGLLGDAVRRLRRD